MSRDDDFREWAGEHRPTLVRTATLLTAGDGHAAEDLVQTTLTRLYLAWPRVRTAEFRLAYARRALVKALRDEARRSWRRVEQSQAELPEVAAPAPAEHNAAVELYTALAELPPRMRAAIVLRYFHDLDTAETARALQCTQGTVKSQTARGLAKLRARLGPLLRPDDPQAPAPLPTGKPVFPVSTLPVPRSNA